MIRRLFPPLSGLQEYERLLRSITHRRNEYLLNLVELVCRHFEGGHSRIPSTADVQTKSRSFSEQILAERDTFVLRNQRTLLDSLKAAA